MIEIGKLKRRAVRERQDGKFIPVLDETGQPLTQTVSCEVWRETKNKLGGGFGPDGKRKLIVGLCDGDVLVLKPKGTRQLVSVELKAVYGWCLRNKALAKQLEKARVRKAVLQARRERRSIKRAEKRLVRPVGVVESDPVWDKMEMP